MATRKEVKERLVADSRWGEFVALRDSFKDSGKTPATAHSEALTQLGYDSLVSVSGATRRTKSKESTQGTRKRRSPKAPEVAASGSVSVSEQAGTDTTPKETMPALVMADFADKPASAGREDVLWVGNHVRVTDVTPKDAPSAAAWNMLLSIRYGHMTSSEFYRQIWPKAALNQRELDRTNERTDDGRKIFTVLDRLSTKRTDAILLDSPEDSRGELVIPA